MMICRLDVIKVSLLHLIREKCKGTSGQGTQKRGTWDLTFRVDAAEENIKRNHQYW